MGTHVCAHVCTHTHTQGDRAGGLRGEPVRGRLELEAGKTGGQRGRLKAEAGGLRVEGRRQWRREGEIGR